MRTRAIACIQSYDAHAFGTIVDGIDIELWLVVGGSSPRRDDKQSKGTQSNPESPTVRQRPARAIPSGSSNPQERVRNSPPQHYSGDRPRRAALLRDLLLIRLHGLKGTHKTDDALQGTSIGVIGGDRNQRTTCSKSIATINYKILLMIKVTAPSPRGLYSIS